MSDASGLEMDFENYLLAGRINLKNALTLFTQSSLLGSSKEQLESDDFVAKRRIAISQRMISGLEKDEFPISLYGDGNFEDFANGKTFYNFEVAYAPSYEIIKWANGVGIAVPSRVYEKVVTKLERPRANESHPEGTPLSGKERQELGRLQVEKNKWDESIQAAVEAGMHFANIPEGEVITRNDLADYVYKAGYKSLPNTTIDKIWKALPEEIRCKGGRSPGSKDVH